MLNTLTATFYERDIRKLIEEINLFKNEENLWRTRGFVNNSSGNLGLHVISGTNYLIGTALAQTGYVRDRDQEFIKKGIARNELVAELEALIPMIRKTLHGFSPEQMEEDYPIFSTSQKLPSAMYWFNC